MTAPALRSPLSERDFLRQVVELAEIRGWAWLHIRPGMTRDSWRTPISGPLGRGWVDLVLVREKDARLIFAELKAESGKLTDDQKRVREILQSIEQRPHQKWVGTNYEPTIEVVCWRPFDWPEIEKVLK